MAVSIRESIIQELMSRIAALTVNSAPLFQTVHRGDLATISNLAFPAAGVYEGEEQSMARTWPFVDKMITVFIEVRFQMLVGQDSYSAFNDYLFNLQKLLFGSSDALTLGGLCMDVQEKGCNPEIEGQEDANPGGTLVLDISYRHRQDDPSIGLGG